MSEPRCDLTELLVSQCGHCNGAEIRTAEPPAERGPWIIAQYDGFCAGCPTAIDHGDAIRSDGDGRWLCDDCGRK